MKKERREKAKELRQQITVDKYDSPEGLRIRELCGYELGSVIKLPCEFRTDEKGNVIVDAKLKKPFRKCTEVELGYSGKSLALCWIKVYSKELKGLSEDEIKAEIEGMQAVLSEKFKAEIRGWLPGRMALFTNSAAKQHLAIYHDGYEVSKPSLNKDKRIEKVWTVSLILQDDYFKYLEPDDSKPPVDTTSGLDAL